MKEKIRTCPECGEKIIGRIDKKFCTDQCRNTYNNRLNSDTNKFVRNINNILRKNRRILQKLNPDSGKIIISKEKLVRAGFNFNYHTHTYTTRKKDTYVFCYDHGYLHLPDKEQFLLVARSKE